MLTVGIDFASQPENTAPCVIEWGTYEATIRDCRLKVTDSDIEAIAATAEKVGVDVPFGWPKRFIDGICAHRDREPWTSAKIHELRYRRTDFHVRSATAKWPLSVSSDRIACTAFRWATLSSKLEQRYDPINRIGSGRFVEVYPRAARDRWQITSLQHLFTLTNDWLAAEASFVALCEQIQHCFDALVGALVARAPALGLCDSVSEDDLEAALIEGWIVLPRTNSLSQLR